MNMNTSSGRVPKRGERVTLKGQGRIFAALRILNELHTVDLTKKKKLPWT
jgi:hypothetical protein